MTSRSAFGNSLSRCQTLSGGLPDARFSASKTSCSRLEPGKRMMAACIEAGPRATATGLASRCRLAAARFRAAARAARFALAPLARLARFGHGDGDRLAPALHLAAPATAALQLAVLILVHHLLDFASLSRAGHLEPSMALIPNGGTTGLRARSRAARERGL